MTTIVVKAGISDDVKDVPTVFVGQKCHFSHEAYFLISGKVGGSIGRTTWEKGINQSKEKDIVFLHLNQSALVTVSDKTSRGNTPSNSIKLFTEFKNTLPFMENGKVLNVVLFSKREHVMANVVAIARCFPTFSKKTNNQKVQFENVIIEVVAVKSEIPSEIKTLTDGEVDFLNVLCEAIQETGRLIDTPANMMTTDALVEESRLVARELGCEYRCIRGEQLREEGFGGIYHVGKAGPTPPAFVVLSHKPKGATETIALVGKGVVFDTGGMQIKAPTLMIGWKRDMSGAATMLEAFYSLVKAGFDQNLHVCLCIVENNISPMANKPDDIITLLSGHTVEISNTDAEGRLILADGVFYAKNHLKATTIVDMATLTGAQKFVTGQFHAAILTNCEIMEELTILAGKSSGDLVGPMIFSPDLHFEDFKSPVADYKNSNFGTTMGFPSGLAGLFIGKQIEFGEGIQWLHVDICMPCEKGERATGFGVALLCSLFGKHTRIPLLQ